MLNKEGFYEMVVKWLERGDISKYVYFFGVVV